MLAANALVHVCTNLYNTTIIINTNVKSSTLYTSETHQLRADN